MRSPRGRLALLEPAEFPGRRRRARAAASRCCSCSRATACWRRKAPHPFARRSTPPGPAPRAAAVPGQGRAAAHHLLRGRGQPRGFLGLQARAVPARRQRCRPMPRRSRSWGRSASWPGRFWEFKPRGRSGKMLSDLFPHLAELADDICFIHSLTGRNSAHTQAENFLSTGLRLRGLSRASARGRPTRWAARTRTCRRSSPSPIRAAGPRPGPTTGAPASCRRRFRARPSTPSQPPRNLRAAGDGQPARATPPPAICWPGSTTRTWPGSRATRSSPPASPATSWPAGCRRPFRPCWIFGSEPRTRSGRVRRRFAERHQGRLRPQLHARPPAARAGRARRAALQRRLPTTAARRTGTATRDLRDQARHARGDLRSADRRAAPRPAAARPARADAGRLVHRVRPHALHAGQRHRPRPQHRRLHLLAHGRRREGAVQLRRDRRARLEGRAKTGHASTTSTPRSCTCWASITSG